MNQLKKLAAMALLCMVGTILHAQKIVATGQVVDQSGETVIGATVMEKGTSNGTITDFDGNFNISVNKGATLVVSYVGFITQELPAATDMKIVIKEDAQSLQEVVVTGYTTQR
ncbi:MAG: carboxypeptidase-like regulatory domain-containing protein, partial [Bacteroidales bacterium]|nr:carboxypeptidase-like regulatory domain-containing protein [Bacteroidales bacterium]